MKKASVIISISFLVLTACGNENSESNTGEAESGSNDENHEQTEVNEEENSANNESENENELHNGDSEESEENNENNENNETEEESASNEENEEEAEVKYEIRDDSTIGPLEDADENVLLLTIDDAPDNHGVEMAEKLAEMDADAIFFVNGHFIDSEEGEQQLLDIYDLGFEIGNHTMTHPNLSEISDEQAYEEIVDLNDLIEDITGERPRFFRAPFGVNTEYSEQIMEEEDMQSMNWSYGYDYFEEYMEAEALAEIMVEAPELRDGANLLMHDRSFTLEALEDIVNGLEEKGYEFVDPDEIQ